MSNYSLADFVSTLKVGRNHHCKFVDIKRTRLNTRIVKFLYENGIFSSFSFHCPPNLIRVTLKYFEIDKKIPSISLVSTPGHRVRWKCGKLATVHNASNLSSFYVISTSSGLRTSTDCLFARKGGEVLLLVKY